MLMTRERRPAIRTLHSWAINVLNEAGAIRECEDHGWMQDRADPHARERAVDIAREDPPPGVSPQSAAVAIAEVLDSIGDTCPECPPPDWQLSSVGVRVGWVAESGFKPPFLQALSRHFCSLRILQMFLEEGNKPGERFADRFGLAAD
jgi:hypothetical protein